MWHDPQDAPLSQGFQRKVVPHPRGGKRRGFACGQGVASYECIGERLGVLAWAWRSSYVWQPGGVTVDSGVEAERGSVFEQ